MPLFGNMFKSSPGVAPNQGGATADPQLTTMAQTLGVKPPAGGTWMQQFQSVADQAQIAIMICDVCVPGMKVQYTNAAGERLVGYTKAEHVGKNCRFMQGKRTEAAAVRAIVKGIRSATTTTVRITNYKKDGTQFVNVLTLHPVHDSTNTYRYSIGVQSDGANSAAEGPALDQLRRALPTRFDVSRERARARGGRRSGPAPLRAPPQSAHPGRDLCARARRLLHPPPGCSPWWAVSVCGDQRAGAIF